MCLNKYIQVVEPSSVFSMFLAGDRLENCCSIVQLLHMQTPPVVLDGKLQFGGTFSAVQQLHLERSRFKCSISSTWNRGTGAQGQPSTEVS